MISQQLKPLFQDNVTPRRQEIRDRIQNQLLVDEESEGLQNGDSSDNDLSLDFNMEVERGQMMLGGGYDESDEKGPGDIEEKILIAPRGGGTEPSAPDKGELDDLDNLEEDKRKESSHELKFNSEDLDVNDSSNVLEQQFNSHNFKDYSLL